MKLHIYTLIIVLSICSANAQSKRFNVSSEAEFENAHNQAGPNDSIIWKTGTYSDVFMDITKHGIIVTAEQNGSALFNGASKVEIDADDVTLSGLQFVGGNIGTSHVIRIWGSDVFVTQLNIQDYTSYKYLIIDEDSKRTTVSYSNFENRLNLDDQNILSILVDTEPGYHKIQYCSFKNFEGTGNDLGIEPIRIGVSSQAHLDSRSIVEYCYFTSCDGDGEIISNKAAQNVIRYNTFQDNSKAELVLRHGDEAIVYGNFFINNMGGVRVREGSGHFIYNNYFEGLNRRAIYLQNESSDPLSDIGIYHNTIINSQEFILGGDGSNPPTNVTIANNIFTSPQDNLFEDATGSETWLGNVSFGSLGITRPSGITDVNPKLSQNSEGYFQPDSDSPAIDASVDGYPTIPLFAGLDYDNEIMLDLMKQERPTMRSDKDAGASEYSSSDLVKPHAREDNTGPSYLSNSSNFKVTTSVVGNGEIVLEPANESYTVGTKVTAYGIPKTGGIFSHWAGTIAGEENPISFSVWGNMEIEAVFVAPPLEVDEKSEISIYPNPVSSYLTLLNTFTSWEKVKVEVVSMSGKTEVQKVFDTSKQDSLKVEVEHLVRGIYFLQIRTDTIGNDFQIIKFVKR